MIELFLSKFTLLHFLGLGKAEGVFFWQSKFKKLFDEILNKLVLKHYVIHS